MKIKKQTSQILELGNSKFYLGRLFLFLFATPFFCAGIAVIFFMGTLNTLQCNRVEFQQISCQLIREGLRGKKNIDIGQVYSTELGISGGDEGDTYRIELNTSEGIIPLTEVYSSGSTNKRKQVKKINNFITDKTQNSLKIKQDDRLFAYPFGGIFVLVGGSLMLGSLTFFRQINCIFNNGNGTFFIREDNLFQSKIKQYGLGEIKEVIIVEEKDSDGDKILKSKIILHRGLEIPLDLTGNISEKEKIIKSINHFLQLTDFNKN
ncbi:cysteine sulfinate desulfinase/cysteine desulfurase and related enzymes [Geminocystis sp. NIES-3708]|uniref:hypothetical protein n=1 Tax=Geminocystis sp. NIES-3708 TaxID=1615909 RepID=UPI0005FC59C7|nr:hypothetical protein [Geminocystis sp. NIES-3708]BAQ61117.1 cysteine sulfinate desulfinase/cysteine desulfurase and related enzymes [Geminocystis sp. NIES-3708]